MNTNTVNFIDDDDPDWKITLLPEEYKQKFNDTLEMLKTEIPKENKKLAKENVNHPKHYNREGGMECIDEMILVFGKEAVRNFCLCNAWKYRYRAADKNGEEDLKKSDWYLNKYKELKEESSLTAPAHIITVPSNPDPIVCPLITTPWDTGKDYGITCTSYNTTGEFN
jgi:hypothetical protein